MEVFIGLVLIVTTSISTVSVLQWKSVKQHLEELKDAKQQYRHALTRARETEAKLSKLQKDLDDCKLVLNMRSK